MISDTVMKQIRGGENASTEFVTTLSAPSVAKAVCAFLNSGGGTVFCGIGDQGQIIGVGPKAEIAARSFESELQRRISPKTLFSISVERSADTTIVVVEVPAGRDGPYVYDGRVFIRHGAQIRMADGETLRSLIQARAIEAERWERRPAVGLGDDGLDYDEIRACVDAATASGRFVFKSPNDHRAVLRELGMWGQGGLTQSADILFGREVARRHPQAKLRLVRYRSEKTNGDFLDDRWFGGPAVQLLSQVMVAMENNIRIQSRFRTGEMRRENVPQYAAWAVREGIVNALVHRDYASFSGGLTVSIYPERLEIWNSGRLPKTLKPGDLRKVHPSIPTNPDIAHGFYMRDLMDQLGVGTQRIIANCRAIGAAPPKWVDNPTGVTLTLFPSSELAPGSMTLNLRQQALIEALSVDEPITPSVYHERFARSVSERQARRDLVDLFEARLLNREGGGATTTYRRSDVVWPNRT